MTRQKLMEHLLEQAHAQKASLDQTMDLLGQLARATELEEMAWEWCQAHPPRVHHQLLQVDSVSIH